MSVAAAAAAVVAAVVVAVGVPCIVHLEGCKPPSLAVCAAAVGDRLVPRVHSAPEEWSGTIHLERKRNSRLSAGSDGGSWLSDREGG